VSNSYYNTFTVSATGKYYIYIMTGSAKEVSYGIMYKNNSNDTSLDEEIAIEKAKNYMDAVTANPEYMNALKNYIKKNGEYEYDKDWNQKHYTISEKVSSKEFIELQYDIDLELDSEYIAFYFRNYHNGVGGAFYPCEFLYFGWLFDSKYEFIPNQITYTYSLDDYCKTRLRTAIDIKNSDYGKIGCNFKFITRNYSDINDSEQIRKNATAMYNRAIWMWEELLERAEGQEGFIFSDLLNESGGSELPPDEGDDEGDDKDKKDKYSVYNDDQRTDLSDCTIANIKSKVYDGKAYTPTPKVTMRVNGKNKKLVYGKDYRLLYANNTNAGKGTVWVIGIGNYKGNKSKTFFIDKKNIGKLKKVAGSIEVDDTSAEPIGIYDGVKLLTKGVDYDYEIAEDDVSRRRTAIIEVSAVQGSNYTGKSKVKVPVIDADNKIMIKADDIKLDVTSYDYDGRPHTPRVTVTVDGEVLEKKNYSVTYKNNKNRGTAYVIVKGKGKSYTGTAIAFFDIVTPSGKTGFDSVVVNKGKNVTYNGKLQKPKVVVRMNGKKLAVNKDYTLEYTSHFNAGKGKVKVTGIGNYEGLSNNVDFTIEQRLIKKASIKAKSSTNYTVKYAGKILVEGIDYEVECEEISGTNKVNLKFKGLKNFSGEITKKKVKK
ncbi:MAG: hypothetical protein K2K46_05875, partial [Lachnospiraceae bacterium]|nr:hypothetical protein [Lachnospiraceae bacterium]